MAKGFSIMDIMNEMSKEGAATETETIEKVSVYDIQPNEDNFYQYSNIEELKNSIYAMGGVQQNLLLVRLPEGSAHKYKALAGHRRREACLQLVLEGHKEFELVPAVIKENIDSDTEETLLVMTNSTQRTLTDWEKVMQHMKLKEIIPKLKKRQGLDGKTRALESDYLGISEGQIAIYNTIGTKLNEWLMDWFKNGKIGISIAYEAAKLEPEQQEQLVEIAKDKGNFTEEDIKRIVGSRPIEGQMMITEQNENDEVLHPAAESKKIPTDDEIIWLYNYRIKEYDDDRDMLKEQLIEKFGRSNAGGCCDGGMYDFSRKGVRINGSDYITYSELVKRINMLIPKDAKVTESDTFAVEPEISTIDEKPEKIPYSIDRDNINHAISLIFDVNEFPTDKFNELLELFRQGKDGYMGYISQESVFDNMLPYENSYVRVKNECGYRVEFIHTNKIINIPRYPFWKEFEKYFEWEWREEPQENIDEEEKVTESDTFEEEESPAAEDIESETVALRGGYDTSQIDELILNYEIVLKDAIEYKRMKAIYKYNCLLDALELLKQKVNG